MTPSDRLSFWVDWERDGTYDHALSNITPYVLSADWTLGFQEPYQTVGGPSEVSLLLDNSNGDWNLSKSGAVFAGVLLRDVLIRIQYVRNAQTFYLGTYKLKSISISPGAKGERTVRLVGQDWYADLMSTIYDPPLTLNTRTGVAVKNAIEGGGVPGFPLTTMNFIVGGSLLDTTTILPNYIADGYLNCFDGQTILDYVGDNIDANGEGITLFNFINEMCIAEMGGRFRFQVNAANGHPCYSYYARTTLAEYTNYQIAHTIDTSDFYDAEYTYGSGQANHLEITYFPRELGAVGSELARSENGFILQAGESRTITLRYRDPDNPEGSCAAITIITPVASNDYIANSESDGSGTDYTSDVYVAVENMTNAAKVTITNTAQNKVYITLLKIRGTPMTAKQAVKLSAIDGESISSYGLYKNSMTIGGTDENELIQSYADWFVRCHSIPYAEYKSITFDYTDETDAGLATYVYEPLSDTKPLFIQDNWTEDTADASSYWVCGMRCSVYNKHWEVTLILENYNIMSGFWTLGDIAIGLEGQFVEIGFSKLDVNTRLAF